MCFRADIHRGYLSQSRDLASASGYARFRNVVEFVRASWVMITRRALVMAQNTCTLAKYQYLVCEKAAAAPETSRLLASPRRRRVHLLG
jgi:hypothetical protein